MLDKLKLLLHCDDEELLITLMNLCKEEAYIYCNLEEYSSALDYIVIQMVIERYNRLGSEGLTGQTSSGVSASYDSFYSQKVERMLNKHRKVKCV